MKLNLKTLLALVLTLCLLLGSMAALAEGFTVADGETAGEVVVTVSDVTGTNPANDGILINAYGSDDKGHVTFNADGAGVNDPDVQAKLDGATTLTVNAGTVTEKLDKPVEYTNTYTDSEGNEQTNTYKDSYVTGVFMQANNGAALTAENVITGAINVSTTTEDKDENYASARGVQEDAYSNNTKLAANVSDGINVAAKAIGGANATGADVDAYRNDATLNVNGGVNVSASTTEYSGSATGIYVEGELGNTANVTINGGITATGASEKGRANAYGVDTYAYSWQDGESTEALKTSQAIVNVSGDITATASGATIKDPEDDWDRQSSAVGIDAYSNEYGNVTVNEKGNVTATATSTDGGTRVTGIEAEAYGKTAKSSLNVEGNVKAEGNSSQFYSEVNGVYAYTNNGGESSITVNGNVDVANNSTYVPVKTAENQWPYGGDARGVEVYANADSKASIAITGNVTVKSTAPEADVTGLQVSGYSGAVTATVTGNIAVDGQDWTSGVSANSGTGDEWYEDENGNEQWKKLDKAGSADVTVNGNVTATLSSADNNVSAVNLSADALGTTKLTMAGDVIATNDKGQADAVSASSNGGVTTLTLTGDAKADAKQYATGLSVWASDNSSWEEDPETKELKEVPGTKVGTTTATVVGDVTAKVSGEGRGVYGDYANGVYVSAGNGSTATLTLTGDISAENASTHAKSQAIGLSAYAGANSTTNVAVIGDVKATGDKSYGMYVSADKTGTANVLIDGMLSGGTAAIHAYANTSITNEKGETTTTELDPSKANIVVWKAEVNADGHVAQVEDSTDVFTAYADGHTDEDGSTGIYESTLTANEAATAKLEAAIWYIVKVAESWKDKITATGTSTYAAEGTTYDVAHEDENVTLKFDVAGGKTLSAIMYNDGTKADYVDNGDGTYTVKMLRGGAMELSLKLKDKKTEEKTEEKAEEKTEEKAEEKTEEAAEKKTETAATEAKAADVKLEEVEEANGVKAEDHEEIAKVAETVGEALEGEGENVSVTILGIEKVLDEEEMKTFNTLPVKDRLLVALSALGFADDMSSVAEGMSDEAKALSDAIAERMAGMDETEKQALLDAIASEFPKGTVEVDGVEHESFSIDLLIDRNGEKTCERYTFYDDEGTWKLYGIEKGAYEAA